MIKIFLVEDEVIIRNGIKNSINWEEEGYEFVGESSDGELAYPLILKEKPDILITDIRMPFMDGLELSESVKKVLPDTKILILSGHNDFEYAKRAISIGITDYLLKPISADKLLEAIGEVVVKIEREREDKELLRRYVEDMRENTEQERYHFFTRLITEPISITDALELGKQLDMNLSAELYQVVLFKIWEGELTEEERKVHREDLVDAFVAVENYVRSIEGMYCIRRGVEGWAFLCLAHEGRKAQEQIEELAEKLREVMSAYTGLEYFGGIGKAVSRLRNLRDSFREADKAFGGRFTVKTNRIVSSRELHHDTSLEDPAVSGLGNVGDIRELIAKFLKNGTKEEVGSFIEMLFSEENKSSLRSMIVRQYVLLDFYISVTAFGESLGIDSEETKKICREIKVVAEYAVSETKIRSYMEEILMKMVLLRDTVSGRRYSDIIETAQQYILQNYMSENISLNTVATSVNMSPSYFSSIFSQEAGQTFVEYLTNIRMERAKELLMCSSKKTSEIGFEIGYKDAHYFSYIFKKTQQCSPKEYRTRGRI